MPTWGTLRTEVYDLIDETSTTTLNDFFLRAANRLQRQLQPHARVPKNWDLAVAKDALSGDTSGNDYADIYDVIHCRRRKTSDADTYDKYSTIDLKPAWTWGQHFFAPDYKTFYLPKAADAYTYRFFGFKRLTDLADTSSTPEIEADFHDLYVDWCVIQFGERDDDFSRDSRYQQAKERYPVRLAQFIQRMLEKGPALPWPPPKG